ncbi:MAG: hypothetical protein AAF242_10620, partial [Bacteroidota bacterium]
PVLRVMQLGLWCFIVISSITVFFGVHAYIADYLDQQPWLVQRMGYLATYVVLSIIPDLLCSISFAHVVRSLLKQKYRDVLSIILNVAMILIVLFLGRYSWRMSRSAATSAANDMVPKVELADVTRLDSISGQERQLLRKQYEDDVTAINKLYDHKLEAALSPLNQKALPYRKQVESLENSRSRNNTNWIDKQLKAVNKRLLPIEEKISTVTARNEDLRSSELRQLETKYQEEIGFLNNRLFENRANTQRRNGKVVQQVESLATAFTNEFRKIAGWAIVLVLLLTALLEILYHRNGIERDPVFTTWNFRLTGFFEVVNLPFTFVGRHTLNAVRRQYAKLPALEQAPTFKQSVTTHKEAKKNGVTRDNTHLQSTESPVNTALQPVTVRNDYDNLFGDNSLSNDPDCEETISSVTVSNKLDGSMRQGVNLTPSTNGIPLDHAARGNFPSADFLDLLTDLSKQVRFITDELFATCALPGCEKKFRKKRSGHKYCCEEHRQKAWELRNGKKLKIKS